MLPYYSAIGHNIQTPWLGASTSPAPSVITSHHQGDPAGFYSRKWSMIDRELETQFFESYIFFPVITGPLLLLQLVI